MNNELKKDRALSAMLESTTLTEAAEKAGISRKTLYNYIRNNPDFGAAYRSARDQVLIEQMEALNGGTERATRLLLELMDDAEQPASIRMRAAQTLLTTAAKQHEMTQGVRMARHIYEDIM